MLRQTAINDKQTWESLVEFFPESNFLQSWNWGVFQQSIGKEVIRLVWFDDQSQDDGRPVAIAQGVVERAKRGDYLAVAGGPLFDWENHSLIESCLDHLRNEASRLDCQFIRFRPQALSQDSLLQKLAKLGLRLSPMHLTADLTLQLDLTQSEEDLLADMRKNHRSTIKKAKKQGITTRLSTDPSEIKDFYQHQVALAKHHGFVPFSYDFLYEQFLIFAKDHQAFLVHALRGKELLATAYVIAYRREAVYHYGISTPANQRWPGSYLAQWRAIQEAKQRGCVRYNLWGVAPKDQPRHRFAGVSLFKRGFGGEEVNYLKAHDLPLNSWYHLVYFFESLRRYFRRV